MDIRENAEALDKINAILNNRGIAEIKLEQQGAVLLVVEISRSVKYNSKDK